MTFPILPSNAAGGYQTQRSLRFNSADSAYLTRTFSTNGTSTTTKTISFWVKRGSSSTNPHYFFSGYDGSSSNEFIVSFDWAGGYLLDGLIVYCGGVSPFNVTTSSVYRDFSAWYHFVIAFDTTQATASNRVKIYANGTQVTALYTANYPNQNSAIGFGYGNGYNKVGANWNGLSRYGECYLTEINFIDGQALDPSYFGAINATTGQWEPKAYSGSYGTNGFYLNFKNNSTISALGTDYSGNGNNWTPNNFSVTAGAGNDSMWDYPANVDDGGNGRGNYCTLNPLSSAGTLTNGNLDVSGSTKKSYATASAISGKWYAEFTVTGSDSFSWIGIATISNTAYQELVWQGGTGGNSGGLPAVTWGNGDIISVGVDVDSLNVLFYKNNALIYTIPFSVTPSITSTNWVFAVFNSVSVTYTCNFGQRPFAYTAPSGFKALCTQNLPTPTIGATASTQAGKYFNAVTWTGDGSSSRSITGVGFQPDFTWLKTRSNANQSHHFVDVVRGYGTSAMRTVFSEQTNAEESSNGGGTLFYGNIQSLNSDGFTVAGGNTGITDQVNKSSWTYVAWNWKANGAGVTNTAGSITSTVSANTTSGFSIVTYTGTGSAATVGHGLGVAPKMVIVKSRSQTGYSWYVYQKDVGNTKFLELNTTAAPTTFNLWESTNPTSSVFTISSNAAVNNNGSTYVAYCFAEIAGYSKFGSYTGNGSADGPFVYCGFRPRYIMLKCSSIGGSAGYDWIIQDTARSPINLADQKLTANSANAENIDSGGSSSLGYGYDILSNGFKIRNAGFGQNASGATYIFAAFAESPFKFANAR